jgi:predicted RND superfamily exporter protein
MKSIVELILRAPRLAAALCVFALILAGLGIFRIGFDDGSSHVFASKSPVFQAFMEDRAQFPNDRAQIVVHLRADSFAQPGAFFAARDFALELGLVDGLTGAISAFSLRNPPDAGGNMAPLFGADLKTEAEIGTALKGAVVHPLSQGRFITSDLAHMLVVAQSRASELSAFEVIAGDIDALAREILADSGVDYVVSGTPTLRVSAIKLLIRDQMVINVVAALVGFIFCLLAFRSLVPALVAGLPAVLALTFVLGFLGYSGAGINTASNTLPVLILVLAFADSMHLTYETRRRIALGETYQNAVRQAFALAAMPCALASVTTALAFAALLLSGSELVQGLGRAGSTGVLISLVVVLVFNPLLAIWAGRFDLAGWTRGKTKQTLLFPTRIWQNLLPLIVGRARMVSLVLTLVLVGALGLYVQISPRYSFLENVPAQSKDYKALEEVERLFAPLSTYDVMVPVVPDEEGKISAAGLMRVGRLHEILEERFGANLVVSAWSGARWIAPDAPQTSVSELNRVLARAGLSGGNGFVSGDGELMKISVLTSDPGSIEVKAMAQEIEALIAQDDAGPPARVGGALTMSAFVTSDMILDLNRSFLVAVLFSGAIIAIWMRSLMVGLVAVLVNVLPISLVGGWLVLSGQGLQFTSGLALTIAFGIAVDDTLHALNRLRPKLIAGGRISKEDIYVAFVEVAPVLTATSVILSFGLAATFLSQSPTISYFGALSIFVFMLALLADLIFLPALLVLVRKVGHADGG